MSYFLVGLHLIQTKYLRCYSSECGNHSILGCEVVQSGTKIQHSFRTRCLHLQRRRELINKVCVVASLEVQNPQNIPYSHQITLLTVIKQQYFTGVCYTFR